MTTKATNVLTPVLVKLATSLAKDFADSTDFWPTAITKVVAHAIDGYVTLERRNAKTEKTIDDDAFRIINEVAKQVAEMKRKGVVMSDATAEGKRSDFRKAIEFGLLKKENDAIDGMMILADVRDQHVAAKKDAKEIYPAMMSVIREQVKRKADGRLPAAEILKLVKKAPTTDSDAADIFASAAAKLKALYAEEKKGAKDDFAGNDTRLKIVNLIVSASKELTKLRDEKREAEKKAAEPAVASVADQLAAFGKEAAAAAAKKPTKRGK
jgi:hypothetical protein